MLQELMNRIAREEVRQKSNGGDKFDGLHSFWPEEYPRDVSHGPFKGTEKDALENAGSDDLARCEAFKASRRYLPCHYFDYIFGSSTGA